MSKIFYYVDTEKAKQKSEELGIEIQPLPPFIKHAGLYGDAGMDLFAAHDFTVEPHSMSVANSFVGVLFDPGVAGLLFPRGGDNFLLGAGVIDTGYTGTIRSKIINPYNEPMEFHIGDSIGQVVFFTKASVESYDLHEIETSQIDIVTERGPSGRITNQFSL
jgi:dUTPase